MRTAAAAIDLSGSVAVCVCRDESVAVRVALYMSASAYANSTNLAIISVYVVQRVYIVMLVALYVAATAIHLREYVAVRVCLLQSVCLSVCCDLFEYV